MLFYLNMKKINSKPSCIPLCYLKVNTKFLIINNYYNLYNNKLCKKCFKLKTQ